MKVCLIKPPILFKGLSFSFMPSPPLGLAYIAGSLLHENYEVDVIDCSAEGIDNVTDFRRDVKVLGLNIPNTLDKIDPVTEIFCLSFMFTNNWLHDRELVRAIKNAYPKSIIVAGGEHATAAPELCLNQSPIDYIVMGEGEQTIVELLDAIKNNKDIDKVSSIVFKKQGELFKTIRRRRIQEIKEIPWPAWHLFPLEKYFSNEISYGVYRGRTLPVMATRGCPYECTFCSSPQMWGRNYEMRPPSDFIDELEFLHKEYGVVNFDLFDLTAIIHKKWILEMCEEIVKRGLVISFQLPSGTRAEAIDLEVSESLWVAGCRNITYAPESGSEKILKDVKKKVSLDKMLTSIKYSSQSKLNIKLNMIIGFPDETHKDIWSTILFLVKCSWYGANDAMPATFSPYPGSNLFNKLQEEKKLDLYSDEYFFEIINSYDLWPTKVYSQKINPIFIKLYSFLILIIFYFSNYLFRPIRLYRTLRNVFTNQHESRLEQILYKNFIAWFVKRKNKKIKNFTSNNI